MSFPCWLFLALLACLASVVNAAPSASTFILSRGSSNLTFSLNIDKDSDDIYFRLTAPTDWSWVAIGAGGGMRGALMFVVYQGKDSKDVTLSPRIGTGNVEPTYSDKINATLVPGSGIVHDQFVVNARCTNCRKWDQGSLSVDSESQEFIYALGPTWSSIRTDSKSALMQRHIGYGFFTMNLKQAKGDAGVPEGTRTSTGSESSESIHSDYNFVLFAHIVFMVGSFVVLLPLGVLFLRAFQKVKLHSINQNITVVIILIGGGMGIYLSTMFNLTRSFSTGHQILGLILMGLIVVQSVLGFLHHRAYLRTQRRTVVSHAHIWHGRLVILLGILNGFLGLHLAGRSSLDYLLSLIAFAIVYAAIFFFSWSRLRRKRNAYTSPRAANFRDDDPSTFGNSTTDIPLTAHAAPPAYQAEYVPPGAPPGRT